MGIAIKVYFDVVENKGDSDPDASGMPHPSEFAVYARVPVAGGDAALIAVLDSKLAATAIARVLSGLPGAATGRHPDGAAAWKEDNVIPFV